MKLVNTGFDKLALNRSNEDALSDVERLCTLVLQSDEVRWRHGRIFTHADINSVVDKCFEMSIVDTLARALVHANSETALLVLGKLKALVPDMGFSKLRAWYVASFV